MKIIENVSLHVSRRGFLHGALASGVFVLSARFIPKPLWAAEGEAARAGISTQSVDVDRVRWHRHHRRPSLEMGCGSRTALPLVVADETRRGLVQSKIDQAIGDPKYGDQDTDGSHSVRSSFDLMRQVGATGRVMLISAAAAHWGVSSKDCTTEPHFVSIAPAAASSAMAHLPTQPQSFGSEKRRCPAPAQEAFRMALHWQREQFSVRPSRDAHRQSDLRHGRDHARHGLRIG